MPPNSTSTATPRPSLPAGFSGPLALIVLDGYGLARNPAASAIAAAQTPNLDRLFATCPHVRLAAHGTAVGMPSDDDMGNSEVGHNAIGAGQIYAQGAALVSQAIASGAIWQGQGWQEVVAALAASGGTLHLLGLFSDGNVHSHIDHLRALVDAAPAHGIKRLRLHLLFDGRDVAETSALDYLLPFEEFLAARRQAGLDVRIASGGGRQQITMDRYEANWPMVEAGWRTHVLGEGRQFASAAEAIATLRSEAPGVIDQDLPPFVIAAAGEPLGTIADGDAVILFNFRGDRAIEISRAFTEDDFSAFARRRAPRVTYAGMLQYDGDLQIPARFLVAPPAIANTLSAALAAAGVSQYAVSETQKFGHVTYFWNGNRSQPFAGETWEEIASDRVPFEERPWMKAAEISDAMIAAIQSGKYRFLRCNYANGDMVGHTGNFRAASMAVEAVDLALGRLLKAIDAAHGIALITADHGNADEMYELDKKTGAPLQNAAGGYRAKTAHTLNPVPLLLFGRAAAGLSLKQTDDAGLANIAATLAELLGVAAHPDWRPSLLAAADSPPTD